MFFAARGLAHRRLSLSPRPTLCAPCAFHARPTLSAPFARILHGDAFGLGGGGGDRQGSSWRHPRRHCGYGGEAAGEEVPSRPGGRIVARKDRAAGACGQAACWSLFFFGNNAVYSGVCVFFFRQSDRLEATSRVTLLLATILRVSGRVLRFWRYIRHARRLWMARWFSRPIC